MKYEVWSAECQVSSVRGKVHRVSSVKVKCSVWSAKCRVKSQGDPQVPLQPVPPSWGQP